MCQFNWLIDSIKYCVELIDWKTTVGIISGAFITIIVEGMRRPKLRMEIGAVWQGHFDGVPIKSLNVRVYNDKPLPCFGFIFREPAMQCRANITFYDHNGCVVSGGSMSGRWSDSPQPVPTQGVDANGRPFLIYDPEKLTLASIIDIYPDESQAVDIVARADGYLECYGWNNEVYFYAPPRLFKSKWKLPSGKFLVKISVTSSGQNKTEFFSIVNGQTFTDFSLSRATKSEISLVNL